MKACFVLAASAAWLVVCGSAENARAAAHTETGSRISRWFGIERLANPYQHWPTIVPGVESRYFSSFDREGANRDGFVGTWSRLYVDEQRNEDVIFDAVGPG